MTRVAAYAICTDGDAILLCRIAPGWTVDADGMWTLPGGGLEFGEHPADGALRELAEETGLLGELDGVAGIYTWSGTITAPEDGVARDYHSVGILYRTRVVGGELRDELHGSTDTCRWVRRTDVSALPVVGIVEAALPLAFPDVASASTGA